MKANLLSFIILLSIASYQFASWLVNTLTNPSWLAFPTVPVVALGAVAFFVAIGLQLNYLWNKAVEPKNV